LHVRMGTSVVGPHPMTADTAGLAQGAGDRCAGAPDCARRRTSTMRAAHGGRARDLLASGGGMATREEKARRQRPPEQGEMRDGALGVLELLPNGTGFIRRREANYLPRPEDVFVGRGMVQKFGLRTGDELAGAIGRSPGRGKGPPLTSLVSVNGRPPEEASRRPDFTRLSAVHPRERLVLECDLKRRGQPDYTNRIIDLFCPFGKGQRALIVAPAKAGKTMVLQAVAEGITRNHPEFALLILLVDERPEEVTEMEACGFGEVVASSFDKP